MAVASPTLVNFILYIPIYCILLYSASIKADAAQYLGISTTLDTKAYIGFLFFVAFDCPHEYFFIVGGKA